MCGYLGRWFVSRSTHEMHPGTWLFNFQHVLLTCPFCGNLSHKTALIFISCSILHQLNTKPNTIESHKIQGNNLMQLQYFLSRNKANIKHSCKSQLYNISFVLSPLWHSRIFQFSLHKNVPLDRTLCFVTWGLCFYIILIIRYQIRCSL